jgi:hypothetical protein
VKVLNRVTLVEAEQAEADLISLIRVLRGAALLNRSDRGYPRNHFWRAADPASRAEDKACRRMWAQRSKAAAIAA